MTPEGRRFWAVLGIILVVAATVRVGFIVFETRHEDVVYDATYYTLQARDLARGKGFNDPFALRQRGETTPAADHPPFLVFALLPAAVIPDITDSKMAMRFTVMLFGLAAVAMTGVLGRTLAGDRVGLVAAAIAALSPNFWLNDGLIMSEAPAVLFTALALWLTYRARDAESWKPFALLGAVCGLAALTRAELALLAPLMIVPAAIRRGAPSAAAVRIAAGLVAALIVVLPWLVYNQSRFEERVWLSTNDGIALAGSNCDSVYYGRLVGYTALWCLDPTPPGDQSQKSDVWRARAVDYVQAHRSRVPAVVATRVLRTWQVWDPFEHARYNVGEGRPVWASTMGILTMWVLFPLVAIGLVAGRRRRTVVWPLVVPIALVTLSSAVIFGQVRFRAPAEPSLAVLGAIGIVALVGRYRADWALAAIPPVPSSAPE